jgi:tRNA splicing ligase
MKFPAKAYVKYNGYLGLLGYDKEADEILVASKSDLNSAHARWFQSILYLVFDRKKVDFIKEYMQDNNCTLVWEVIDPINDPHMIKYDKPNIVLLSIVYNKLEFEEASFMELQRVANLLGVDFKQVATTFENWTEFEEWYKEVTKDEYKYKGQYIEGFVIKDSNKFMTKIKGRYYSFWKRMRSIKDEVARKGNSDRIEMLKTPLAIDFYRWCKVQTQETLRKDIIQTREQYYSDIGEIGI